MNVHHKILVQQSFAQVQPIADAAAALFYARLFTLDPSLRPLFRGDMQEQGRKLMQMLQVAVSGLDRLDKLVPAVQALGQRHVQYRVQPEHYATVGEALIWTLEQGLGPDFTEETRAAWVEVYLTLATTMQTAMGELQVA
jgi:hemoglobin-like flavoprotein